VRIRRIAASLAVLATATAAVWSAGPQSAGVEAGGIEGRVLYLGEPPPSTTRGSR
jgi:hypothetical protein